jgi:hypothetical protein
VGRENEKKETRERMRKKKIDIKKQRGKDRERKQERESKRKGGEEPCKGRWAKKIQETKYQA